MKKEKKAVSPIVATVLLIMIVVILAIIILLWANSFIKEAIVKTIGSEEKRAEDWCREIQIEKIIENDDYGFRNSGNIPIFAFKVKTSSNGDSNTERIDAKVNNGASVLLREKSSTLGAYEDYNYIKIIPIILGKSKDGTQEYECPESDDFKL